MNDTIIFLNEKGYYLDANPEKSVDRDFNVARYVLRDSDERIVHEILIHEETRVEEVSKKIDTAKRQRII